jgi:hypothetical protein
VIDLPPGAEARPLEVISIGTAEAVPSQIHFYKMMMRLPCNWAGFTGCEKTLVEGKNVSGHDFSHAVSAAESMGPLGPEEGLRGHLLTLCPFSAACLVPAIFCLPQTPFGRG